MSTHVLELIGVRAAHGGRAVLHGIDLTVARGEWVALLGANGSGKSSLLDCCVGRLAPRAGTIRLGPHSIVDAPLLAKQGLGYAIAPERLPMPLSARQCLAVQTAARALTQIDAALLELAARLRLDRWLDDPVALMSYGTRQKLGVLLALVGDPPLLVFDESLNGLDPASSLVLKRELRARVDAGRCGVLLATHALDVAEHWADRAVLLHEGRLLHGWTRAELVALGSAHADGFEGALAGAIGLSG